jgi:hypothetical protein
MMSNEDAGTYDDSGDCWLTDVVQPGIHARQRFIVGTMRFGRLIICPEGALAGQEIKFRK